MRRQVFKKADVEDDNFLALSSGVKKGGKKARGRAGERKDEKPVPPCAQGQTLGSGRQEGAQARGHKDES